MNLLDVPHLTWSSPEGSSITLLPTKAGSLSNNIAGQDEEILRALYNSLEINSRPFYWNTIDTNDPAFADLTATLDLKNRDGYIARGNLIDIQFVKPKQTHLYEALYQIEDTGVILPARLAAQIIAYDYIQNTAPSDNFHSAQIGAIVFGRMVFFEANRASTPVPRMSRNEIESIADAIIEGFKPVKKENYDASDILLYYDRETTIPILHNYELLLSAGKQSSVNHVRILMELAKKLTDERNISQITQHYHLWQDISFDEVTSGFVLLSGAGIVIKRLSTITYQNKTELIISPKDRHISSSPLSCFAEWQHWKIDPDTLHKLSGGQYPTLSKGLFRMGEYEDAEPPAKLLCDSLSAEMIKDSNENAVYAPSGIFELHLDKSDWLMANAGITKIRLSVDHNKMIVATYEDSAQPTLIIGWRPGSQINYTLVEETNIPVLNLILSSIWRDLRVAGPEAFPKRKTTQNKRRRRHKSSKNASRPSQSRSKITLPANHTEYSGAYAWGSQGDRQNMRRCLHSVRGHLRYLPAGWSASEEAKQRAFEYGILLPEGHTFVRPFSRGSEKPEEAITEIKAKGLANLTLFLEQVQGQN